MLELKNISKWYNVGGSKTYILRHVSLIIREGEFISIMGPSGSGKSTLLNILGMLDSPSGGDYYFTGENVARFNEKKRSILRKQKIGFIFQNFNLIDELTIFENIELPLIYLHSTQKERREKLVGPVVNLAAHLCERSNEIGGGILIDQETLSLVSAEAYSTRPVEVDRGEKIKCFQIASTGVRGAH